MLQHLLQQQQCSHVEPDWGRFLYGALSLCEHIFTAYNVETLTVVNSCILSLDITDGQSEVTASSTATESGWSPSMEKSTSIYQEFGSLSRLLFVPAEAMITWLITTSGHILAGFTGHGYSLSWKDSFHCRSLSHTDLSFTFWNTNGIMSTTNYGTSK